MTQQVDLMQDLRDRIVDMSKKKEKKELIADIKQANGGLGSNLKGVAGGVKKLISQKNEANAYHKKLQQEERQYYMLLRQM